MDYVWFGSEACLYCAHSNLQQVDLTARFSWRLAQSTKPMHVLMSVDVQYVRRALTYEVSGSK
jgi:hypothetical protein